MSNRLLGLSTLAVVLFVMLCVERVEGRDAYRLDWRQHAAPCRAIVPDRWEDYIAQRQHQTTLRRRIQSYVVQMVLMPPNSRKPPRRLIWCRVADRFGVPARFHPQLRRLVRDELKEMGIEVKKVRNAFSDNPRS